MKCSRRSTSPCRRRCSAESGAADARPGRCGRQSAPGARRAQQAAPSADQTAAAAAPPQSAQARKAAGQAGARRQQPAGSLAGAAPKVAAVGRCGRRPWLRRRPRFRSEHEPGRTSAPARRVLKNMTPEQRERFEARMRERQAAGSAAGRRRARLAVARTAARNRARSNQGRPSDTQSRSRARCRQAPRRSTPSSVRCPSSRLAAWPGSSSTSS